MKHVKDMKNIAFLTFLSRNSAVQGEEGGVRGYQFPFLKTNYIHYGVTYYKWNYN
ncbi:MAG: hypothetical protein ACFFDF_23800 [Candidatus Odinarchaeota archaeon]